MQLRSVCRLDRMPPWQINYVLMDHGGGSRTSTSSSPAAARKAALRRALAQRLAATPAMIAGTKRPSAKQEQEQFEPWEVAVMYHLVVSAAAALTLTCPVVGSSSSILEGGPSAAGATRTTRWWRGTSMVGGTLACSYKPASSWAPLRAPFGFCTDRIRDG